MTIDEQYTPAADIPAEEIHRRIIRLQHRMNQAGVEGMLLSQNIDLLYFTGTMQSGYAFIPATGSPKLYIRRSVDRARQESIVDVQELTSFRQLLASLQEDYPNLCSSGREGVIGADLDVMPAGLYLKLQEMVGPVALTDGSALIREVRMVKSAWEIERIERAAAVTAASLEESLNYLKPGITELDWMARLEYEMRLRGHIGVMRMRGYNQEIVTGVVSSGAAAAVPTYFDGPAGGLGMGAAAPQGVSRKIIGINEPILIDIGCCVDGYVIDQTRTAVIGELPDDLMQAFSTSVMVIRKLEPLMVAGTAASELYTESLRISAEAGLEANFMGSGKDQARFIGHGIGLEIDEWPVLARGFSHPLTPGMVLAVEPKYVYPGRGVVGLENTYVVTNGTPRVLTRTREELITVSY
ncbi:M24 family metallopeptidase [Paenibacillus sp. GCM10023252]|uniref:M24 family metallopeptidase n=1 Tax=Paenibacillus sp. GCM10023252 TaxID=3252649 RepID=UPI0036147A2D